MRVLITGGSGFIGHHITRELLDRGHAVTVADIKPPTIGVPWINCNILLPTKEISYCKTEAIIHLASAIGVQNTDNDFCQTLDTILLGTRNVTKWMKPNIRLLFTSTSEVYGDAVTIPTDEMTPVSPKSVYAAAKLAAEYYVQSLPHWTIVRYFSVYGPAQAPSFVIPKFITNALESKPIHLHGDGTQVRAFCHVEDIARATVDALLDPIAEGQIYNIGNDEEPIAIRELANQIVSKTKSKSTISEIDFIDSDRSSEREIWHRIPAITKAALDLNYVPTINLDDGLDDTINYYRTH